MTVFSKIVAFVKAHPKTFITLLCIVVGSALFTAGRMSNPAKVVEVEKTITVTLEKEVVRTVTVTVEKLVYVKNENRDVTKETTIVTKPDGSTETKIVETDKTKTTEASTQETASSNATESTKESEIKTSTEKSKLVDGYRPSNRLGLGAGLGVLRAPTTGALSPVVDLRLNYEGRIAGPFWLGGYIGTQVNPVGTGLNAFSSAFAGISASLEF